MGLDNLRHWRKIAICIGILSLIISLGLTFAVTAKSSQVLAITLFSSPPKDATQYNSYPIQVSWANPSKDAYQGYFLFIVELKQPVNPSSIVFTFKGTVIQPIKSGTTLMYYLPMQTFHAGKSGTVTADVVYDIVANYKWQIGITQTKPI
jgi:hypothetical protein